MSHWTHINGMIKVTPLGRTQPEKRYILDTVIGALAVNPERKFTYIFYLILFNE